MKKEDDNRKKFNVRGEIVRNLTKHQLGEVYGGTLADRVTSTGFCSGNITCVQ
jgi:hypothetical protein